MQAEKKVEKRFKESKKNIFKNDGGITKKIED